MQIHHKKPSDVKTNLLYIMGGTWRTKSMFDLDFPNGEKSFRQLLNDLGVETFAFDIHQTNHSDVVNYCLDLIQTHNIKNVMGYSYGCLPAIDLSSKLENIILLDPFSGVNINHKLDGDYLTYDKSDVIRTVDKLSNISKSVKDVYYDTLEDPIVRSSSFKQHLSNTYSTYTNYNNLRNIKCKSFIAFTKSSSVEIQNKFSITPNSKLKVYNNASHWILIEPDRIELCRDIANRIII